MNGAIPLLPYAPSWHRQGKLSFKQKSLEGSEAFWDTMLCRFLVTDVSDELAASIFRLYSIVLRLLDTACQIKHAKIH